MSLFLGINIITVAFKRITQGAIERDNRHIGVFEGSTALRMVSLCDFRIA